MQQDTSNTGLCKRCAHSRTVENPRGSTFYLCELSETDSRFPKYPRLPILTCDGFTELNNTQQHPASS